MQSQGSSSRLTGFVRRSRISSLMLSMLAMMSTIYVAGRLWQDAENRVYLIKEMDRRTGQGHPAISVDDTWKIIACKDQKKKLLALETELATAREEGFVAKYTPNMNGTYHKRRAFLVVGIATEISHKKNRDAIRRSWMPTGAALRKMEEDRGIIIRFFVGKRAHHQGNTTDPAIGEENAKTNDFIILDDYIEDSGELPRKTKSFFVQAADSWDAEFYAKVNDDVFVNLDGLVSTLRTYQREPRVYVGCMKSGEVFTEQSQKWYEPEWWRFGDGKSYFRHAAGQMFVLSRAVAQFVSINKAFLLTYAHDDVTIGSWMIGLDVKHADEAKFCCSSWSPGAICATV
ncbi:putative beta-1-3-galactosyltransferase 11 [Nymphaea thermarum]|nr:putative beta-1-3-galactosyltransferase 11 [Nymphaea thermarum]